MSEEEAPPPLPTLPVLLPRFTQQHPPPPPHAAPDVPSLATPVAVEVVMEEATAATETAVETVAVPVAVARLPVRMTSAQSVKKGMEEAKTVRLKAEMDVERARLHHVMEERKERIEALKLREAARVRDDPEAARRREVWLLFLRLLHIVLLIVFFFFSAGQTESGISEASTRD